MGSQSVRSTQHKRESERLYPCIHTIYVHLRLYRFSYSNTVQYCKTLQHNQHDIKQNDMNLGPYLCLVLAASALECVGLQVSDGNESAQVTDVDTVGVRDSEQPLVEELGSSVGNLTVSLHLSKPQTSITAGYAFTSLIHSTWHNVVYTCR